MIKVIIVLGALNLLGCKEQLIGEPIVLMLYFSFVTAEGGDFFKSDDRYNVNDVTFSCRIVHQLYTLNNKSVFETNYNSCESFIDFGNGDRDTLKVEWLPYDYFGANAGDAKDLEKVIFTYNGVVIETWNFNPDLQFFWELVDRNAIKLDNVRSANPIVITIPKVADENELD